MFLKAVVFTYHRPQEVTIPEKSRDFSTDQVRFPLKINNVEEIIIC